MSALLQCADTQPELAGVFAAFCAFNVNAAEFNDDLLQLLHREVAPQLLPLAWCAACCQSISVLNSQAQQ